MGVVEYGEGGRVFQVGSSLPLFFNVYVLANEWFLLLFLKARAPMFVTDWFVFLETCLHYFCVLVWFAINNQQISAYSMGKCACVEYGFSLPQ